MMVKNMIAPSLATSPSASESEELLRLTQFSVDRVSDMMSWISPEGRFLFVNHLSADIWATPARSCSA